MKTKETNEKGTKNLKIMVPAVSTNLGCGVGSIGLAMALYLTIKVEGPSEDWEFSIAEGEKITSEMREALKKGILQTAPDLAPKRLVLQSTIPPYAGFHEEVTALVAGLEVANRLGQLGLNEMEKIQRLAPFVKSVPALVGCLDGGFVVSLGKAPYKSLRHYFPECDFLLYLPKEKEFSGNLMPTKKNFTFEEVVAINGVGNLLVGALFNGDLKTAGELMNFPQANYEWQLENYPDLKILSDFVAKHAGYGCFITGEGPGILILTPPEKTRRMEWDLKEIFPQCRLERVFLDTQGLQAY